MSDLRKLAKPFPGKFIHSNPSGGGSYVKHHVVNQRLLMDVGPFDFSLVEIVRGMVPGRPPNPNGKSERAKSGTPDLPQAVVGVVARLTVTIDGQQVTVEEAGDCEEPKNWPHDGARMKDAMSDAFKRCAMRLGLGLHLWSQDEFFLNVELDRREQNSTPPAAPTGGGDGASPVETTASAAIGNGSTEAAAGDTDPSPAPSPQSADSATSNGKEDHAPKAPGATMTSAVGGSRSTPAAPPAGVDPSTGEIGGPPVERMTPQQNRRLFAMLNGAGIVEDAERHKFATEVLRRPVASYTDLDKRDAAALFEALKQSADGGPPDQQGEREMEGAAK